MPVTGADEARAPRLDILLKQVGIDLAEPRVVRPMPTGPVWDLLQGVMDEAFEAVHKARLQSRESEAALDDHKRQIVELEAHCEQLQREHDNVVCQAAAQQQEIDRLSGALAEHATGSDGESLGTAQKQAKFFYNYLNDIAGLIASSDRQMTDIRAHYTGAKISQADMIEELNFARSETLAHIGRLMQSLADRAKPAD